MNIYRHLAPLALSTLLFASTSAQESSTYQEPYRPQYHFSPAENWMNDPNGLVYFEGEYHLFYQHNPEGRTWGHMSWGHAVSSDLVHWKHLPLAIPEKKDRMAFSGCVVVDKENVSGLSDDGSPILVSIYTGYRQSDGWQAQFLAYSLDRGRTWKDYSEKPILDISSTDFRDPNVFPYGDEWRMVIALPTERKVQIYSSKDLKSWEYLSEFGPQGATGGAWECPDLFPLAVEGEETQRWVLQVDLDRQAFAGGSGGQYFVGQFDGDKFVLDQPTPATTFPKGAKVAQDFEVDGSGLWKLAKGSCGSTRSAMGLARSEPFEIDQSWLNFEIKGGRHPDQLEARLVVAGQVVKRTTGFNGVNFQPLSWDVSSWQGQTAVLELSDQTTDLWGYLELGRATLSNKPALESRDLAHWIDYGPDYYACISFHNLEKRRVWLAWMNNWLYGQQIPTNPWRSSMSVAREIGLKRVDNVLRLTQRPVKELDSLRRDSGPTLQTMLSNGGVSTSQIAPGSGDLTIRWRPGRGETLTWSLLGLDYTLDLKNKELRFERKGDFHPDFPNKTTVPLTLEKSEWQIRLLYDRSSVELFTQEGTLTHTARTFAESGDNTKVKVAADAGEVRLTNWEMESIW